MLILLKYFVKFPVRQSISCEQSSQVHGGKDDLSGGTVPLLFFVKKLIIFMQRGYPPLQFMENSAKKCFVTFAKLSAFPR